jgi:hypothetical protein
MIRRYRVALVALACAACLAAPALAGLVTPAFAQAAPSPTTVGIPWGDWLAAAANAINILLVGLVGVAFRHLPEQVVAILRTLRVDQLLEKAIDYGVNATAGAVRGRIATFDIGNAVVAEAMRVAIDNGPGWLLGWVGGEKGLREKIIARLELPADLALR